MSNANVNSSGTLTACDSHDARRNMIIAASIALSKRVSDYNKQSIASTPDKKNMANNAIINLKNVISNISASRKTQQTPNT